MMNPLGKKTYFTGRPLMLCIWAIGLAITTGSVRADVFRFTNAGKDGLWINANNWICKTDPEKTAVPGDADEARIGNATVRITAAVKVSCLKNGADGPGEVVIDGGALDTTGTVRYNSASYKFPGTLIIKNGGSATINTYFIVGFKDSQGGRVEIYDGTLRVARS